MALNILCCLYHGAVASELPVDQWRWSKLSANLPELLDASSIRVKKILGPPNRASDGRRCVEYQLDSTTMLQICMEDGYVKTMMVTRASPSNFHLGDFDIVSVDDHVIPADETPGETIARSPAWNEVCNNLKQYLGAKMEDAPSPFRKLAKLDHQNLEQFHDPNRLVSFKLSEDHTVDFAMFQNVCTYIIFETSATHPKFYTVEPTVRSREK
jgi:hypothetical protein